MARPKITNALKGALGETYYKELCSQRSWAYCSLEVIYRSKDLDAVTFKMGFERVRVNIPESMRPEVLRIAKPSNRSSHNPSFVFDYLACKIGQADTSRIQRPQVRDFCWAEVKTGLGIFSDNQYKTLSEIRLPIAIFHIEDVLAEPKHIEMDWEMTSGAKFARMLDENDDDYKDDYRNSGRSNSKRNDYGNSRGNDYKNSHDSSRSGMVAKFGGTCNICKRKIIAGKDRVAQDRYSKWVHAGCAPRRKY